MICPQPDEGGEHELRAQDRLKTFPCLHSRPRPFRLTEIIEDTEGEMKPLKLYWSSGLKQGRKNFGDWLSPLLVRELSGREVIHTPPNRCDLVAIGSLLQRVKHHWWNRRLTIWGTGFIAAGPQVPAHHEYHALRGQASAAMIRGLSVPALGDPGLLAAWLLPNSAVLPKSHAIGLVPHYKDQPHPGVQRLQELIPQARLIDVLAEPLEVLRAIAGCEFILSSSLHGLIVADAFGLPNAWFEFSSAVRGARFKFRDYYSAFGIREPQPLTLENFNPADIERLAMSYRREALPELQQGLVSSFPFPAS